jgi:tRNA-specific 2-thiouridylase
VFYDAQSGQARVLGGGFIKSAAAKSSVGSAARNANVPDVAAMRV